MTWDRLLWGIEFTGGMPDDKPGLIGTTWMRPAVAPSYMDEPTRPCLFYTRQKAREWCKAKMAEYSGREDCCARWRFRPVRVRELVTPNDEVTGAPPHGAKREK